MYYVLDRTQTFYEKLFIRSLKYFKIDTQVD